MQPLYARHIQENPGKKISKSQKDLKSARNMFFFSFKSKIGKKYVYKKWTMVVIHRYSVPRNKGFNLSIDISLPWKKVTSFSYECISSNLEELPSILHCHLVYWTVPSNMLGNIATVFGIIQFNPKEMNLRFE